MSAFAQAIAGLASTPRGLDTLRRSALAWISERGFPTAKDEAWKYTRLGPILELPFEPAEPETAREWSAATVEQLACDYGGARLVFVNGFFKAELSSLEGLPEGAQVTSLASMLGAENVVLEPILSRPFREEPQAFTALNAALAVDGAYIRIPANTTLETPIHLVFISDPSAAPHVCHPRSLVLVGARSRATLIETHAGAPGDVYLTNVVTDVILEEEAELEHYKLQIDSAAAFHVALLGVRQGTGSRFAAHSIALGSAVARHEVRVVLEGPGAEVALNGLYMPEGEQQLVNPTTIDHVAPRCTSRELYKGIVGGRGGGVFDGRIIVRPGAMKTDASQTNKNLLLSDEAQAYTRPRLEIFADDVKCAHGAAVGQLAEDAVFYLRSRGISEAAARGLLTQAFAGEMLERIAVPSLRARVEELVARRLGTNGSGRAA